MAQFNQKPGTRSAVRHLKNPISDVMAFQTIVKSLILKNPLGCTSYMKARKNHAPVEKIRERYTAKFLYENAIGKQNGSGLDMYDSVDGYLYGIAAVISNMANNTAHRGKVRHIPDFDLFSVILKCHDQNEEFYFLSIARDRVTLSSYEDDAIQHRVEEWARGIPALE